MFKVEYIGNFNPFDWPDLKCPVCGKNEYTSLSHTSVWCDNCNAEFKVRYTAGDPGCVIDCLLTKVHWPKYVCKKCNYMTGTFDKIPSCPEHGKMKRMEGVLTLIENKKDYYYLVLKLGDSCSKWMHNGIDERKSYPTQEQWDKYQTEVLNK